MKFMEWSSTKYRMQKYDSVRPGIEDGDVFLFRGQYLVSKVFRKLNCSYYSHVALAVWWGQSRLMILQAEPRGIQAVPMSVAVGKYKGVVDWYKLEKGSFKDPNKSLPKVIEEAKADLGKPFGYIALLRNIWYWIANVKLKNPARHPKAMFCSMYVEHCFRKGGMSITDKPDIATFPKDIAASKHLTYIATIPHDPKLVSMLPPVFRRYATTPTSSRSRGMASPGSTASSPDSTAT